MWRVEKQLNAKLLEVEVDIERHCNANLKGYIMAFDGNHLLL